MNSSKFLHALDGMLSASARVIMGSVVVAFAIGVLILLRR